MAVPDPPPRPGGSPPLPWSTRLLVAVANSLHADSLRTDGTVNRFLLSLFDRTVPPTVDGVVSSDHLSVRLFTPTTSAGGKEEGELPVVVYFHGGGFVALRRRPGRPPAVLRRRGADRVGAAPPGRAVRVPRADRLAVARVPAPRHLPRVPADDGVRRWLGRAALRRGAGGPRGGVPRRRPRVLPVPGLQGVAGRRRGVREPPSRAAEETPDGLIGTQNIFF
jgi:hypothetical protein